MISDKVIHDLKYGISRYPYEASTAIGAFSGDLFDHQ